jgi:hypothetical protein
MFILICDEPNDKKRSVFRPASLSSLAGIEPAGDICLAGRKTSSIFIFIVSIAYQYEIYRKDAPGAAQPGAIVYIIAPCGMRRAPPFAERAVFYLKYSRGYMPAWKKKPAPGTSMGEKRRALRVSLHRCRAASAQIYS